MKNYLKILKNTNRKSSAGFTLIELLAAVSLTTIVIGAAGFGVSTIMGKDQTTEAQTERRVNLNRALDFISDEIRRAEKIEDLTATDVGDVASKFSLTNPQQEPVLALKMPEFEHDQRIIYSVSDLKSDSVWLGPKVIRRWGPSFNADGSYGNPNDPDNWNKRLALVDRIDDESLGSICPNKITEGWEEISAPNGGFSACVDPTGRIAEIEIKGELAEASGREETYEVNTQAFARSAGSSSASPPGSPSTPPSDSPSGSPSTPPSDSPSDSPDSDVAQCTVPNFIGDKIKNLRSSTWNDQGGDIEVGSKGNGKVDTQSPQAGDTVPCTDSVEVSK